MLVKLMKRLRRGATAQQHREATDNKYTLQVLAKQFNWNRLLEWFLMDYLGRQQYEAALACLKG
jgi:hypothetical protein